MQHAPAVMAHSVIVSWTRIIVDALVAHGVDPQLVMAKAGISRSLLADPAGRIPVQAMRKLWQQAAREVGDPAFGLRVSKHLRHSTFHALGYAVLASASLRDALERMARYTHLVSEVGQLALEVEADRARVRISLRPGFEWGGEEAMDAILSGIVRVCRNLREGPFPLRAVSLHRPQPADVGPYQRFFQCPLQFGADNCLDFDAALLDQPLAAANPTLARHNDDAARDYLARVESSNLVDRVRAAIVEHTGIRSSARLVAGKLGLSLRTLQRSLRDLGTSYEQVLSELRSELARAYLLEERLSVSEIAFLLGYEHESAFTRAFKRWTGVAPSEFVRTRHKAR